VRVLGGCVVCEHTEREVYIEQANQGVRPCSGKDGARGPIAQTTKWVQKKQKKFCLFIITDRLEVNDQSIQLLKYP
jgi:hypothetical protein